MKMESKERTKWIVCAVVLLAAVYLFECCAGRVSVDVNVSMREKVVAVEANTVDFEHSWITSVGDEREIGAEYFLVQDDNDAFVIESKGE